MNRRPVLLFLSLLLCILPGIAQNQPFHFVVLSDPQFGMYTADKDFSQETANYEFAVATLNRIKPGFVIILGDLVNKAGDRAQTKEFKRISRKITHRIPVYFVAGNHDVGNEPTPKSLASYRKAFGPAYYGFRAGPVFGIVLNSTLIQSPQNAMAEYQGQNEWLQRELETARKSGAAHILIFEHHPCLLKEPMEPDQYENLPLERRIPLLELLKKYGVRHVFAGHTHGNVTALYGELEVTATGPVGKPLHKDGSGIRIVSVSGLSLEHRYYEFGRLPESLGNPRK